MKLKSLLKILISLSLMALILSITDVSNLLKTLFSIPLYIALVVIGGYALGQLISAYKWWLIATASQLQVPFTAALKSYFIGMFVNCFGLGVVGGDVTRAVLIVEGKGSRTAALASVIADRAHGLAVLALLGTVATIVIGNDLLDPIWLYILVAIGITITAGWFLGPSLLLRLVGKENKLRVKAEQVSSAFPKSSKIVLAITAISILFHILQIGLHSVMAYGLGISIPWYYLLVTIPFVNIFSSLPISWNGLGVRETAYIFFLVRAPASLPGETLLNKEQAIAFGALWLLAVTASSALGGVLAIISKDFSFIKNNGRLQDLKQTTEADSDKAEAA